MLRRLCLLSVAAAAVLPASAQEIYTPSAGGNIETVTVTASPMTKSLDDTASIVAKVNRDDILQAGGGNIANALSSVPGVSSSSFAAGASRPIIRGMDSNRVKLVENGLGSSDVSDIGPDHGVPIDPLSTQSIEVVRGAATLRYGSQAIGGVVNVLNNRVPIALPDKPFALEATAAYGSVANSGDGALLADAAIGKFALHADAFYRNAGNYGTPDGTQANSFFTGDGFALGGSYFFGNNSHTGLGVVQYDAKYGIPSDDAFILMRQTKFISRSSFDWGYGPLGAFNLDASYANYSHEEKNPDGSVNTTFKNKELDARGEQMIGAFGPFSSVAVGVDVQNREYSAIGEDSSYLSPTVTTALGGYVFAEAPLTEALHLETSARIENVHISGTPASDASTARDFTPISAAAGLLYTATDWLKLGLTASTAGRAPAQTELFARGAHDGPGTFETGDPALKIERANSLEGSARLRFQRFSFDLGVWSSWFHNYVYGELTGRTCDDDDACMPGDTEELRELNYTQQGAHFRGLEGKGRYVLFDQGAGALSAEFQGDIVRATLNGGGNVPRIPPWRLGGGLAWESGPFDAGVQVMVNGKQTQFGGFDTATPSYTELNASLAWRPVPGYEIALVGHNLTDAVERNAASFNKDVVELPGRDFRVVLRAAL
ncbi:MAG TPA: TonB-dependent receptor [Rhizomicrobium sp.]